MNISAADHVAALLATLPGEVLSLSLGMELDDTEDAPPAFVARMRATLRGADGIPVPFAGDDAPALDDASPYALAWDACERLSDDLRAAVTPFYYLLPVDDLLTVTR